MWAEDLDGGGRGNVLEKNKKRTMKVTNSDLVFF